MCASYSYIAFYPLEPDLKTLKRNSKKPNNVKRRSSNGLQKKTRFTQSSS